MDTLTRIGGLDRFAQLLEKEQLERMTSQGNSHEFAIRYSKVDVKEGAKYTKVDVGHSGKYMVDREGNIWGIKAYGQIHKGHHYGTLDTVSEWDWSDYTAVKRAVKNV